jgi:peptide-methionine (R)-S-oxide reductase
VPGTITRHVDTSGGMRRVEIVCAACGGHMGHEFRGEGFGHATDARHCVNSVSIKFDAADAEALAAADAQIAAALPAAGAKSKQ